MIKLSALLTFISVLKIVNGKIEKNTLVSKIVEDDGTYVATYNWVALNDKIECTKDSNCYGWDISGQYQVKTDK